MYLETIKEKPIFDELSNNDDFIFCKIEAAHKKSELARLIVHELQRASARCEDIKATKRVLGVAQLISFCSAKENIAVISGFLDRRDASKQKAFFTPLWQCRQRECPFCISILSRRTRRAVDDAIEKAKSTLKSKGSVEEAKYKWYFVTLTAPPLPELDLYKSLKIFMDAWVLLRKRNFWKRRVIAGVKSIEFTFDPEAGTYKVHCHIIALARPIEKNLRTENKRVEELKNEGKKGTALRVGNLASEWSDCLRTAYNSSEARVQEYPFPNNIIVDVREIYDLEYLKTYISKSDSWLNLPASELAKQCLIEESPRMVEPFGLSRASSSRAIGKLKTIPTTKKSILSKIIPCPALSVSDRDKGTTLLDKFERLNDVVLSSSYENTLQLTVRNLREDILFDVDDIDFTKWLIRLKKMVQTHREFQLNRLKRKFKAKIKLLIYYDEKKLYANAA
jgi:hypothetical protein